MPTVFQPTAVGSVFTVDACGVCWIGLVSRALHDVATIVLSCPFPTASLVCILLPNLLFQRLQRRCVDHPGKDLLRDDDELRERTRRSAPARILGPALLAGERGPGEV